MNKNKYLYTFESELQKRNFKAYLAQKGMSLQQAIKLALDKEYKEILTKD